MKKAESYCLRNFRLCDLAGARTQDHLLKREVLYQLSYQVFLFLISACLIGNAGANILSLN